MVSTARTSGLASALGLSGVVLASLAAAAGCAGAAPAAIALGLAFLVAHVLLPGWILRAALGAFEGGAFTRLFGAWVLGQGLQIVLFLGSRVLGCAEFYPWLPLLLLPLLGLRRVREARLEPVSGRTLVLMLVLCALAVARSRMFAPDPWSPLPESDAQLHAGNTAELLRHWPMSDPRLAGDPLRYHFFSYALAAGASQVTGLPVWTSACAVLGAVFPLLLACGLIALGERCLQSRAAGFAAAFLVLLHEDLLGVLGALAGLDLQSHSFLSFGVHSSPSACLSLAFLAALLIGLQEWSSAARARASAAVLLLAWGALQSGTKGSTMPVVLAGLGLAGAVEFVRTRRVPWQSLAAWFLLGLGALPLTLWLLAGPGNYASAMLHLAPLATILDTPLTAWIRERVGPGLVAGILACAAWFPCYLGLAGLGCAGRLLDRGRSLSGFERLLVCLCAAGLLIALLLRAPGASQLFFAYSGQLALACLAGDWAARRGRGVVLAGALVLLLGAARPTDVMRTLRPAQPFVPTTLDLEHRAGQEWMRRWLPADAVLVVEGQPFLHSVHSERRIFFETEKYSPRALAELRPGELSGEEHQGKPSPQRSVLYARSMPELLKGVRAQLGDARPLYLVREQLLPQAGGLAHAGARPQTDSPLLEAVYENPAIGIYRVRDP